MAPLRVVLALALVLAPGLLCLAGCSDAGSDDEGSDDAAAPVCVEIDYQGCAQLYPPTWDQVWDQTISTTCSGGGSACHSGDLGLTFGDSETAYTGLTTGTHAQVIAGDAACSPLMLRLESDDPGFRMPPGNTAITEGARCSIATWIDDGATQN